MTTPEESPNPTRVSMVRKKRLDPYRAKLQDQELFDLFGVVLDALDKLDQSIIITRVDAHQEIVFANRAFENLTGYSKSEVLGKNSSFLQQRPQGSVSELRTDQKTSEQKSVDQIKKAIDERKEVKVYIDNYRKDGTHFLNELWIQPILDSSGTVTHFLAMQKEANIGLGVCTKLKGLQCYLQRAFGRRFGRIGLLPILGAVLLAIPASLCLVKFPWLHGSADSARNVASSNPLSKSGDESVTYIHTFEPIQQS